MASDAGAALILDAVGTIGAYFSVHSADPGETGASEIAGSARAQTVWGAADPGTRQKTGSVAAVSVPAGATVTHVGWWTAAVGGTFIDRVALAAPEAYGSAGTLAVTPRLNYPG